MAKQVSPFIGPQNGQSFSATEVKGNDDALRSVLNDHDAMHWPGIMSAPKVGDVPATATTGGSLTAGTTVRLRIVFRTPNGRTRASDEIAVALGPAENAVSIPLPLADFQFVTEAEVYVAGSGAAAGAPCHLDTSLGVNGAIPLSETAVTTVTVTNYPPGTNLAHTDVANDTAAIDPLHMDVLPIAEAQTDDGTTVTIVRGQTVERWGYNADGSPAVLEIQRPAGMTLARYTFNYNSSGDYLGRTQQGV